MRYAGRIREWNDDKGYGFVAPNGGGAEAFVHIKAFAPGSRRPVVGDVISYTLGSDAQGRPRATDARFAGEQPVQCRTSKSAKSGKSGASGRPLPRAWLGIAVLAALAASAALGLIPWQLAAAYAAVSVVTYAYYGQDKANATSGERRIPEMSLQMLSVLGGWPGALIAQQRYRHKTVKASFQTTFWGTVVLNVLGVGWAIHSGTLARMLA